MAKLFVVLCVISLPFIRMEQREDRLERLIVEHSKLFDEVSILRQISMAQHGEIRKLRGAYSRLGLDLNKTLVRIEKLLTYKFRILV